jgi:hypothetical protein
VQNDPPPVTAYAVGNGFTVTLTLPVIGAVQLVLPTVATTV